MQVLNIRKLREGSIFAAHTIPLFFFLVIFRSPTARLSLSQYISSPLLFSVCTTYTQHFLYIYYIHIDLYCFVVCMRELLTAYFGIAGCCFCRWCCCSAIIGSQTETFHSSPHLNFIGPASTISVFVEIENILANV